MNDKKWVFEAKEAALDVLLRNSKGPIKGLPRTAGDGNREPYTRDLMLCSLGICATDNEVLLQSLEKTLKTLAKNQTEKGHIPSLVHDPLDRGASDTTPLFLLGLSEFRKKTKERNFLKEAEEKALNWLLYQSPDDDVMIGQLPTSDWRDEEWVLGYGLYVNAIYYEVLKRYKKFREAKRLKSLVRRFDILGGIKHRHIHEGLAIKHKPYFAQWSYKVMASERFDLVGNSLAIIFGLSPISRSKKIVKWVEDECANLREKGELKGELPPVLFPYIKPEDPDWQSRYEIYNKPGCYHNGGIWPFATGLY
ncbi:MAG: amylo-alpha-1,6-glucosidase, partial [Acidobacteria bacterium]|nr:amylo-alpha-1,6-glucosidase [Acidobacteriota bacterium]